VLSARSTRIGLTDGAVCPIIGSEEPPTWYQAESHDRKERLRRFEPTDGKPVSSQHLEMPALGLIPDPSDAIGRGQGQRGVKARNQARFLAAFEACGSVAKAARWAKVARTSHFEWMREDPTYRPRFIEAEKQAACGLEDEAVRRAREGVRKLVLYKGQPVYVHGEPLLEAKLLERASGGDPVKLEQLRKELEGPTVIDGTAVVIDAESTPVETRST
jgi:hypothetical protein